MLGKNMRDQGSSWRDGWGWNRGIAISLEARAFQYERRNQKDNASFSFLPSPWSLPLLFLLLPFFGLTTEWESELNDSGLSSITGPSDPDSASQGIHPPCVGVPGRGWEGGTSPLVCNQTSGISAASVRNTIIKRSHWNFEFHVD